MSEKHSIASRKRWAAVPASKRSEIMSRIAKIRQKKLGPDGRKKEMELMTKRRLKLLKAKKHD